METLQIRLHSFGSLEGLANDLTRAIGTQCTERKDALRLNKDFFEVLQSKVLRQFLNHVEFYEACGKKRRCHRIKPSDLSNPKFRGKWLPAIFLFKLPGGFQEFIEELRTCVFESLNPRIRRPQWKDLTIDLDQSIRATLAPFLFKNSQCQNCGQCLPSSQPIYKKSH
jgi:hypothetical protein